MKTKKYDKLVRDKIPEIIQKDSKGCVIKNVSDEEKLNYLFEKLFEETEELKASRTVEELADVQEVINAIAKELNISLEELEKVRKQKTLERGGFEKGIVLIETTEKD